MLFFVSGKLKCEYYWPMDGKSVSSGEVEIALISETQMKKWIVREFDVTKVR